MTSALIIILLLHCHTLLTKVDQFDNNRTLIMHTRSTKPRNLPPTLQKLIRRIASVKIHPKKYGIVPILHTGIFIK
eukprot:CAMPEP_0201647486 /NCGR_PEP_ID=MMETSP0493-20130528/35888_1 /ASSEMBLY_ACC=CAM_ASM_000838 /TAXON_ID=420259 /ORGANISM="Thalassiosira gravida, Strain GMp14c1" /LENGTH=75 /DNA_ID=CAMNT_0048122901 /DNA_START=121 /DNA_END=348 /DNA_ORIENTATION=+